MSKIVVFMSMSLDGFVAGADDDVELGLGAGGEVLHAWLSDGDDGPGSYRPRRGVNAEVFDEMLATGAVITGRRTFDHGGKWSGDHHDGVPVLVLTRNPPEPASSGHITYTSDLALAVEQAKVAAGDRDVMMHGASAVQALLDLGLVDEFLIHLVPVVLGRGRPLFTETPAGGLHLVQTRQGEGVVHLRYRVGTR